jgi:hypothetical protein
VHSGLAELSLGPRCTRSSGARRFGSSTRASGLRAAGEPEILGILADMESAR